ncbi:MAG: peptidase S8, partial [Kangiellaceae bacterium]|nr:peptidase S8 [Kangiellaceae bacterium]
SNITINLEPYTRHGRQYVRIYWSGANGSNVDIYRNGSRVRTTANDGYYRDRPSGSSSYIYQVCEQGSSVCSAEATANF